MPVAQEVANRADLILGQTVSGTVDHYRSLHNSAEVKGAESL
jgi:hypothetical protein